MTHWTKPDRTGSYLIAGISKESTTEKCDSTFTSEGSATCVSSVVCGHISFVDFTMVQAVWSSRQAGDFRKPFSKLAMTPMMMNLKYVSM